MSDVFKQTKQQLKYQKKFIEKAKLIHNNKYDYSLVEYKNAHTKIKIICPIHGVFRQTPNGHTNNSSGCPMCIGNMKSNTEDFIKKSKQVHGDKYDYSLVKYKNTNTKVKIICPIHGEFEQNAGKHISGQNCPKCSGTVKLTIEEFIENSKLVHGEKYDYSLVNYKNANTKVKIICPTHGEFLQTPNRHTQGQGCPKCGLISKAKKRLLTTDDFVKKAELVHGYKYDYSRVKYKGTLLNIKIICPIHGEFEQSPNNHLSGKGCPTCGTLKNLEYMNNIAGVYKPKHQEKYDGDIFKIVYRSSYELKAFEMIEEEIENSDFIISWSSEEVVIPYNFGDIKRNYCVDLKLNTKDKIYLIEIKPKIQTIQPIKENAFYNMDVYNTNKAKWKAAEKYCKERNWEFKIWTEKELNI